MTARRANVCRRTRRTRDKAATRSLALRRQRSQVRILSGAPDFRDLASGTRHESRPRKRCGSRGREEIGRFVACPVDVTYRTTQRSRACVSGLTVRDSNQATAQRGLRDDRDRSVLCKRVWLVRVGFVESKSASLSNHFNAHLEKLSKRAPAISIAWQPFPNEASPCQEE
jgi:hypothetical protein